MNPLMVFFFIAMFLEDYFFREGRLFKYYIASVFLYWVFYYFHEKSKFHSASRKLLLASYSQSYDPTIYAKLKINVSKAKEFLKNNEERTGKKLSITLLFTKILAEVFQDYPEINQALRFGLHADRGTVDIGVLVNAEDGKNLANVTLRDIPNKSLGQLSDELYPEAKKLRQGTDENFNKKQSSMRGLPSFVLELLIETVGYLSNLGITFKPLMIESNQFGVAIVTSVGGMKLSDAYAPLCPFSYTCAIFTVCTIKKKKTLNKDGSICENEYLPVNVAIDHRFIDGSLGSKIIKKINHYFDHPEDVKFI